jgi:hypothetical protein
MGFVKSGMAETLGFACFATGTRPRDVLNWTQTEQEVAAQSGMAFVRVILEAYADMWE